MLPFATWHNDLHIIARKCLACTCRVYRKSNMLTCLMCLIQQFIFNVYRIKCSYFFIAIVCCFVINKIICSSWSSMATEYPITKIMKTNAVPAIKCTFPFSFRVQFLLIRRSTFMDFHCFWCKVIIKIIYAKKFV